MDHTRHIGIFSASMWSASLIGAGGIGAMTAIALAKMGLGEIAIYDGDTVDDVNIATQFHKLSDVGKPKAEALEDALHEYSGGVHISSYHEIVSGETIMPRADITISAVDSIQARKDIWQAVELQGPEWYLDTRMSAEFFQMYVVRQVNADWYDNLIKDQNDSEIPDEPCTSKATIYTACIAAGQIGATVRRIVTGQQEPGILAHDILNNSLMFLPM